MTPKAGGVAYEAFIASGWTDELLIKEGYMTMAPAVPAAPPAPPVPPGGRPY